MYIPPLKIICILHYFHGNLIGGHQSVTKTLSSRYYCLRMADYIQSYIVGCQHLSIVQEFKRFHRPLQKRVYDITQAALTDVSVHIKYMPRPTK